MRSDHLSTLRTEKRWLYWQHVTDKNGRPTKIPKRLNGVNASSTNPNSWETFDRLMPIPPQMAGVGIALGGGLLGVDMDACLVDGQLEPWAADVVERLATYAEISPSGGGIKLLMRLKSEIKENVSVKWGDPVSMPDGSSKHRELALYSDGRYFTITESVWSDAPIRMVSPEDLEWLLERIEVIKAAKKAPSQATIKVPERSPMNTTPQPETSRLPDGLMNLVRDGALEGLRSDQFHHAVGWMKDVGMTFEAALQLLQTHPTGIASKYAGRLEKEFKRCWGKVGVPITPSNAPENTRSALDRLFDFCVTDERVQGMTETKLIWRNLIALSHIGVWAAPGNGGKTTIAMAAAGELAACGYQVWYFQEDASAGDLPALHTHSKTHGYLLLNSTLANAIPEDQLDLLQALVDENTDLSNIVMFFDTLKKYNDLMSKGGSRAFFKLMRALTIRGCTIIVLGHTNKHPNISGELVFEGVADVRNDVDELYYIESAKDSVTGMVTLTFRLDKVRCLAVPATFRLDTATRKLTALPQVVDIKSLRRRTEQMREDAEAIEAVRRCLEGGSMQKTELIAAAALLSSAGKRRIRSVIERYCSHDPDDQHAPWFETYIRQNNVRLIGLNPVFTQGELPSPGGV